MIFPLSAFHFSLPPCQKSTHKKPKIKKEKPLVADDLEILLQGHLLFDHRLNIHKKVKIKQIKKPKK